MRFVLMKVERGEEPRPGVITRVNYWPTPGCGPRDNNLQPTPTHDHLRPFIKHTIGMPFYRVVSSDKEQISALYPPTSRLIRRTNLTTVVFVKNTELQCCLILLLRVRSCRRVRTALLIHHSSHNESCENNNIGTKNVSVHSKELTHCSSHKKQNSYARVCVLCEE